MPQNLHKQQHFRVLGLMSGTSLDGLDLCLVNFSLNDTWSFEIERAETIPYSESWLAKLRYQELSIKALEDLDRTYGELLAEYCLEFMASHKIKQDSVDFIASHGHTWHHQPEQKISLQLGNGPELWQLTGIPVICDFRRADVLIGGQGAPLVPIGDRDLFANNDSCLNLGGFANISLDRAGQRIAFDIAPCNLPINYYCQRLGLPYDDEGYIAATHNPNPQVLEQLNALSYYSQPAPKSLGIEWLQKEVLSICEASQANPETLIATLSEHSAFQIGKSLNQYALKNCLISGGGSNNQFIIDSIGVYSNCQLEIASEPLNSFKEALIFAYLGLLKHLGQNNVLASVTGAPQDHSSGKHYPPKS